jgi:hypothetical protein
MNRPLRALCLVAVALSTQLIAVPHAGAQSPPTDESGAHFAKGVQLFKEGDFHAALIEFKRTHDLSKNYRALYNIGQTQLELLDYAGALGSFQQYLAEGGAEIEASRKTAVEGEIVKLEARVARVTITVNEAGADILVDDVVVGRAPLKGPVLVSAGRRKIGASKDGLVPVTRVVEIAGGDRSEVALSLTGLGGPAQGPTPPAAPQTPEVSHTGVWIGLTATGLLTAGAVITGVMALGAKSDANAKLGTFGVTQDELTKSHDKAKTLGLVTDILAGGAIVAGGVTLVVALTGSKSKPAAPSASLVMSPTRADFVAHF